jgi:hypothetical protein
VFSDVIGGTIYDNKKEELLRSPEKQECEVYGESQEIYCQEEDKLFHKEENRIKEGGAMQDPERARCQGEDSLEPQQSAQQD